MIKWNVLTQNHKFLKDKNALNAGGKERFFIKFCYMDWITLSDFRHFNFPYTYFGSPLSTHHFNIYKFHTKNIQILLKFGASNHNLLKMHQIHVKWASSSVIKTLIVRCQNLCNEHPNSSRIYMYTKSYHFNAM